jgi:PEP-CTERM motif-containing protein
MGSTGMAKRRSESNRNGNGRRDLARFVLMLLPGFMFVGLLAPAAVTVKPKVEERHFEPVSHQSFAPRKSIEPPRAVAKREAKPTVDPLFTGARYLAAADPPPPTSLPPVAANANVEDQIVLAKNDDDAVDEYVSDSMFDAPAEHSILTVDLTPLWKPELFDRIPGSIEKGGFYMYDDFHGNAVRVLLATPPAPVPEPQTAALLALGLLALALFDRRD